MNRSETGRERSVPAVVVLGCRLKFDRSAGGGRGLIGAGARRATKAAEVFLSNLDARSCPDGKGQGTIVVASGGRAWEGIVEADALADMLARLGVPRDRIVRERCSHSTHENARYAGELLRRRGVREINLVTCASHLPRATFLFEAQGFVVRGIGASGALRRRRLWDRAYERGREIVAGWVDRRRVERDRRFAVDAVVRSSLSTS